jgi:hypothetical protein
VRTALVQETADRVDDVQAVLRGFDEAWSKLAAGPYVMEPAVALERARLLVDDVLCGVFAAIGGHR